MKKTAVGKTKALWETVFLETAISIAVIKAYLPTKY
jgi:hypothetical protein